MSHSYIDLETRDKLIRKAIDAINTLNSQYKSGKVDTLGFFEELGHWTRETSEMLQTAVNSKAAEDFNACQIIDDKTNYLIKLINHGRKRIVLS